MHMQFFLVAKSSWDSDGWNTLERDDIARCMRHSLALAGVSPSSVLIMGFSGK